MKTIIIHYYSISDPVDKRIYCGEFKNVDEAIKHLQSHVKDVPIKIYKVIENGKIIMEE